MSEKIRQWPKMLTLVGGQAGDAPHEELVFVERAGMRIGNSGPFPAAEVRRLRAWIDRYLAEDARRRKPR
jgi:hypothetical protein